MIEALARNYSWLPFVPVKARGCWLTDIHGRRFLDLVACYSALNFGYRHPFLLKAAKEQLDTGLTFNAGFMMTLEKALLADELVDFCGMETAKIVPMVSGAEAVETAMKLARKWGYAIKGIPLDQAEIIFCENNFHGRTISIVSASTVSQYRHQFGPYLRGIKLIPFGDALALEKAITKNTAAFIVEPIQGEGGIVIPPKGYLRAIRKICSRHNVLLVLDEIQTGFGRTGRRFACDHENIRPDLLVVGKALGGGLMSISAVVGRKEVMDVFQPGDHGSTGGGNALAAYVARAVIFLMRTRRLEKRSASLGDYFLKRLRALAGNFPYVKEVRGRGLMIGVELKYSQPSGHELCQALFEERLIVKETRDHILRFSPPLVITKKEIDWAMARIEKAFKKFYDGKWEGAS